MNADDLDWIDADGLDWIDALTPAELAELVELATALCRDALDTLHMQQTGR